MKFGLCEVCEAGCAEVKKRGKSNTQRRMITQYRIIASDRDKCALLFEDLPIWESLHQ